MHSLFYWICLHYFLISLFPCCFFVLIIVVVVIVTIIEQLQVLIIINCFLFLFFIINNLKPISKAVNMLIFYCAWLLLLVYLANVVRPALSTLHGFLQPVTRVIQYTVIKRYYNVFLGVPVFSIQYLSMVFYIRTYIHTHTHRYFHFPCLHLYWFFFIND